MVIAGASILFLEHCYGRTWRMGAGYLPVLQWRGLLSECILDFWWRGLVRLPRLWRVWVYMDLVDYREGRGQRWETCGWCGKQVFVVNEMGVCAGCWEPHQANIACAIGLACKYFAGEDERQLFLEMKRAWRTPRRRGYARPFYIGA